MECIKSMPVGSVSADRLQAHGGRIRFKQQLPLWKFFFQMTTGGQQRSELFRIVAGAGGSIFLLSSGQRHWAHVEQIKGFSPCYRYFSTAPLVWTQVLGNVASTGTIYTGYQSPAMYGAVVFSAPEVVFHCSLGGKELTCGSQCTNQVAIK